MELVLWLFKFTCQVMGGGGEREREKWVGVGRMMTHGTDKFRGQEIAVEG